MPRSLLISALAVLALALPASALADPGVIERVTQGPAGGNANVQNLQGNISDDGRCVAFLTTEKLTTDDVNNRSDIYERCGSTTTLVSTGPAANAGTAPSPYLEYRSMSADGSCVLFDTNEVLTDGDNDTNIDIFKRCGSDIQRVSQGPQGGNASQDVHHGTMSADGVCVVFQAHEALTDDDHDSIPDLFERCGSTTKRVSQGPAGGDALDGYPTLEQVSADGSCVLFTTSEKLTGDDGDDSRDAYVRCGATTRKLSPGDGAFDASPELMSPDGQCLVFQTEEQLAGTDTDTQNDIYTACDGSLRHDSAGPTGGGGHFYASVDDVSSDGSCVVFSTEEALTSDDADTSTDVYRRCGATIERVSTGPGGGNAQIDAEEEYMSADGRCVLFSTAEHITPDDADASDDLFERCGETTERVSQGPAGGNGSFRPQAFALSSDGTRVVFTTDEKLTDDDDNAVTDIYEHSNGQTTKVSPAQRSDNPYGSNPEGTSLDGSRVMFSRFDRLTDDDTDDTFDLYLATLSPTAANGDATGVTTTGATLHGTSGGDPAAKYHFVVEGSSSTAEADVPAGAGIKPVSSEVTGLAPDTTYRYRLVVTSAGGTTTTSERSFRTAAAPGTGTGTDNSGNDGGTGGGGDQGDPPPVSESFAGVVVRGGTVKVKRGIATLTVVCPAKAQGACAGKLTLKAGRRTVGSKAFSIKPGKTAKVRVRINSAGRKLLKRHRTLRVSAAAVARDARGTSVKTPARVTLKR